MENEYGFYGICDHDYTKRLAEMFKKYVADKAVLFTTDGSDFNSLSCGKIEGKGYIIIYKKYSLDSLDSS